MQFEPRHHFALRKVLQGTRYSVELRQDGTGIIRESHNGFPIAITSHQAAKIEAAVKALVDQMAREAAASPAPWSVETDRITR